MEKQVLSVALRLWEVKTDEVNIASLSRQQDTDCRFSPLASCAVTKTPVTVYISGNCAGTTITGMEEHYRTACKMRMRNTSTRHPDTQER